MTSTRVALWFSHGRICFPFLCTYAVSSHGYLLLCTDGPYLETLHLLWMWQPNKVSHPRRNLSHPVGAVEAKQPFSPSTSLEDTQFSRPNWGQTYNPGHLPLSCRESAWFQEHEAKRQHCEDQELSILHVPVLKSYHVVSSWTSPHDFQFSLSAKNCFWIKWICMLGDFYAYFLSHIRLSVSKSKNSCFKVLIITLVNVLIMQLADYAY